MHAKLTLRLDEELIQLAKDYASRTGKSLSQIVADYFALLTARHGGGDQPMAPLACSLRGALRGSGFDEADYYRHLEEKYR